MVNWTGLFILFFILLLPPTLIFLGFFLVLRFKRQIRAFVRVSEKEYQMKKADVYGKKLKTTVNGKKCAWSIETKPDSVRTVFGLVPFYFCEVGKATTSNLLGTKQTTITEKELALIEEQSVLNALLKVDLFGKESIALMIGALGVGVVAGIIVAKMVLFKGAV